jgi:hypothetical protein
VAPIHGFNASRLKSEKVGALPFWEVFYRQLFPDFQAMCFHPSDSPQQRLGVDRSIILTHGKQLTVDEKVRFKDYGDICLEHVSDRERNTPGWVCKPLVADYIAYVIMPPAVPSEEWLFKELQPKSPLDLKGKTFLLPVVQLQAAWRRHGDDWIGRYRRPHHEAKNCENGKSWTTLFTPVPVNVLYPAIGAALRCEWDYPWTGAFGASAPPPNRPTPETTLRKKPPPCVQRTLWD